MRDIVTSLIKKGLIGCFTIITLLPIGRRTADNASGAWRSAACCDARREGQPKISL